MRISRLVCCHALSSNLSDLGTAFIAYIRSMHRTRIDTVYRDWAGTIHLETIRIAPMGEIVLHATSMATIFIPIPTVVIHLSNDEPSLNVSTTKLCVGF